MELTLKEKSLLLYMETAAVDYGGKLQAVRMNDDDFAIADQWNKTGFVRFGRIAMRDILPRGATGEHPRTHGCILSEEAWTAAHAERRARCQRIMDKMSIERCGLAA